MSRASTARAGTESTGTSPMTAGITTKTATTITAITITTTEAAPPPARLAGRLTGGESVPSHAQKRCENLMPIVLGCAGMMYTWLSFNGLVFAKRENWARLSPQLLQNISTLKSLMCAPAERSSIP